MKILNWKSLSESERENCLKRPVQKNPDILSRTQDIIDAVKNEGDKALKEMTEKFDKASLSNLRVTQHEFEDACKQVSEDAKNAIKTAISNIKKFHQARLSQNIRVETMPGVVCETKAKPIPRVGIYIPAGSAPLISTVLMLGIPAEIAGCPERILCSPPRKDGTLDPHIIYAAESCGIKKIFKVGGAQSIAAMAYGTETIPKVDKIFGPGNSWVTQAKLLVAQDSEGAAYDLPAGPSEAMVIADEQANPAFIAADLLAQAEHGEDSQVIGIVLSESFAKQVQAEVLKQIQTLSREKIATASIARSCLIVVDNLNEAMQISNEYAPEHLILQLENPDNYCDAITSAGSVFLGKWSPEAVGDYASGTNHVLPTYGYAKAYSGLSVSDFMKTITFQKLSQDGLTQIAKTVMTLADLEGLDAHREAVNIRLKQNEKKS